MPKSAAFYLFIFVNISTEISDGKSWAGKVASSIKLSLPIYFFLLFETVALKFLYFLLTGPGRGRGGSSASSKPWNLLRPKPKTLHHPSPNNSIFLLCPLLPFVWSAIKATPAIFFFFKYSVLGLMSVVENSAWYFILLRVEYSSRMSEVVF